MRVRAFAFLLAGIAALVLASGAFVNAVYWGWRTVAPMGTARPGRARHPTEEDVRAFARKGNRQLGYSALLGLAAIGAFGAFGFEIARAGKRRRGVAVEQAAAPDDRAAETSDYH